MTTTSPQPASAPARARLHPGDLAALASIGLRTRKLRAGLSALGIAIGVAAIVAVLGLAASAQAALLAEIARLGTNLLTVTNGQTLTGATAELPQAAPGMIARLPGVTAVQDTGSLGAVSAYKSPLIPTVETNALSVDAATLGLPAVAGASVAQGRFLNAATAREPVAVLGAATAQRLGIDRIRPGLRIWAGGTWFYVTGILSKDTYAPEIDSAVLVGFPAAQKYLHFDGHPSTIYVRTTGSQAVTTRVDSLLGAQASPENPSQVNVSQPSDALTAQADATGALDTLFLGLGAVALLVGAIGVANIMVISVLERRSEIGLRRALGATRGQIRTQFLAEAVLLSLAGGVIGVITGAAATAAYARAHGETVVIPPEAWAGGLAAAVIIGAGRLPAVRAGLVRLPDQRRRQCGHGLDDRLQAWPGRDDPDDGLVQPLAEPGERGRRRARGAVVADRLQHLVGNHGHQVGQGRAPVTPLLQLAQLRPEAHLGEQAPVARALRHTGAAHGVAEHLRAERLPGRGHVVVDADPDVHRHRDRTRFAACPCATRIDGRPADRNTPRGGPVEQRTIGGLPGEPQHLGPERGQVYRGRRQAPELDRAGLRPPGGASTQTRPGGNLLAGQQSADPGDVLAHHRDRAVGQAHRRPETRPVASRAETEHEPP